MKRLYGIIGIAFLLGACATLSKVNKAIEDSNTVPYKGEAYAPGIDFYSLYWQESNTAGREAWQTLGVVNPLDVYISADVSCPAVEWHGILVPPHSEKFIHVKSIWERAYHPACHITDWSGTPDPKK